MPGTTYGNLCSSSHIENHYENQFKSQVETHKQEFMHKLLQAKERMMHNKNALHDHSIGELCGHIEDYQKRKECEEHHDTNLHGLGGLSFES